MDKMKLADALVQYKEVLSDKWWADEKYKWEAVRHFQQHWDVNSSDFVVMVKTSLAKTYNLLASMNNFPRRMIEKFAEKSPQEVRSMFIALYDESRDVIERIQECIQSSGVLLEKFGDGAAQHYQGQNAVST